MGFRVPGFNQVLFTREEILGQIFTLLQSIQSPANVYRNRGELEKKNLPAIVMLDGIEEMIGMRPTALDMKTVRQPPTMLRMQPQIFVVLKPRDDVQNNTIDGEDAPIGPELSAYRDLILGTVINDPLLVSMLTSMGQINFRGSQTDMQVGRAMIGNLRILIDFHYPWCPPQG